LRVYVAGPITHGDTDANVRAGMDVASALLALGHAPYVPQLTFYWDGYRPQAYETWMALSDAWLRQCEAIIRVPGYSPGADREMAVARVLGLPVMALCTHDGRTESLCPDCEGKGWRLL